MSTAAATRTQPLHDSREQPCPLCNNPMPVKGLLHTPDFTIFVRDGLVAQLTHGEAMVLRALFKAPGFRQTRGQLIDAIYAGMHSPENADTVLRVHCMNLKPKLLPLRMGIISDTGIVSMVFTAPKQR